MKLYLTLCYIFIAAWVVFGTSFCLIQGLRGMIKQEMYFIGFGRGFQLAGRYEGTKAVILGVVSFLFGLLGLWIICSVCVDAAHGNFPRNTL